MKLIFVGDCMLGRLVNEVLRHEPPDHPWGDTLPILHAADWRALNLECVLSNRGAPSAPGTKLYHFRSDPKNVAVLGAARITAVSLANNHVLDYGAEALRECIRILNQSGIAHAGAGPDLAEAARMAVTIVPKWRSRIGMIAFTDNEPAWEAGPGRSGVFHVPTDPDDPRAVALFEEVHRLRPTVDLLVVSAHWGPNWGYRIPREHVAFGHALIEAGADIVFGHSGHVFRGIEIYRSRPILYCAGDIVDDYLIDPWERNDESFIHRIEIIEGRPCRLELIPVRIEDFHARLAQGTEARDIARRMEVLCARLGTAARWSPEDQVLEILCPDGAGQGAAAVQAQAQPPQPELPEGGDLFDEPPEDEFE